MNPIVFAIVVVVVLGLAGGVILVLASKFMAVYEDPRIAQVTECLAGANCGGCGYAGCADYAKAIVENGAPTFKCAPGGDKTADAINTIMGNATDDRPSLRATVICAGGENCGKRFDYQGIQTCAAAASIAGGPSACAYGCLGLGDCTRACKFDAIHVINGVAVVDRNKWWGRKKVHRLHGLHRDLPAPRHPDEAHCPAARGQVLQQGQGRAGQQDLQGGLHCLRSLRAQLPEPGDLPEGQRRCHRLYQVQRLRHLRQQVPQEGHPVGRGHAPSHRRPRARARGSENARIIFR